MALDLEPGRAPAEPSGRMSLAERGKDADGNQVLSDRRLYVQLFAFTGDVSPESLIDAVRDVDFDVVLYEDVNDPNGFGIVTFSEEPAHFVDTVRPFLRASAFGALDFRGELAMLGRSYALGYETDLVDALVLRPRRTMLNPAWPWAVWYPLRRSGSFEQLPAEEQRRLLMEHGGIGRAYGRADHAHDIRLACHGLGTQDNDFVLGIVGPTLIGPSALVQHMRQTQQTSLYLERLGPFFVGRAIYQSPL